MDKNEISTLNEKPSRQSKVRNKAVEIANVLLNEGYPEGRAIAIATAQAEKWANEPPLSGSAKHSSKSN